MGNVGSRRKTGRKNLWIEKADISGSAASILIFVFYISPSLMQLKVKFVHHSVKEFVSFGPGSVD